MDLGFILNFGGRTFGQLRHRPRIRLGGRCEPPQGGAGNRRQPKVSRIDRSRWRGRFLAPRPECHGDRRDKRGGDPAYGDFERSDPRLAGLMLRCGREGVEAVLVVVELFRRTPGRKSPCARRDKNPNLLERLFRPAREFGCNELGDRPQADAA